MRGRRETAPAMSDWRLAPAALSAWALAWIGVSFDAGPPLLSLGALLALCALVLGARLAIRPPAPGRHALVPGGSIRAGALGAVAAGLAALLVAGAARQALASSPSVEAARTGALVTLRGTIDEDPAPRRARFGAAGSTAVLVVSEAGRSALSSSAPVKVLLVLDASPDLKRGDLVEARGVIDPSFPGALPFAGSLRARRVRLVERPGGWKGAAREFRSSLEAACADLDEQGRALVPGMAIGQDRAMGAELEEAFRTTSLSHLTAVSGSHMAIVLGVVPLLVVNSKRARGGALVLVLVLLVGVVGPSPAVMRAAATSGAGLVGSALSRNGSGSASLAAVVLAILLLDPFAARDFGFALSASATLGVVGPARAWSRWGRERLRDDTRAGRAALRLLDLVAVPFWCQATTTPVLLLLDPRAPAYGLAANLLAGPAVAPATLLSLDAALVAQVSPSLGASLARLASVFTAWIAGVATRLAEAPGARLEPTPGGVALALLLALFGVLLARHRIRNAPGT